MAMDKRWTFYVDELILGLVDRLMKLRRQNRNYTPKLADIQRQAMVIGLRQMIADETKDLNEAAKEQEELAKARAAVPRRGKRFKGK